MGGGGKSFQNSRQAIPCAPNTFAPHEKANIPPILLWMCYAFELEFSEWVGFLDEILLDFLVFSLVPNETVVEPFQQL